MFILTLIKILILTFGPIVFLVKLEQGVQIKNWGAVGYATLAAVAMAVAIWLLPGSITAYM